MPRVISLILLGVFFLLGCNNSNSNAKKSKININPEQLAELEFDKKLHQFGEVYEGETVGCYFKFINTGVNPLIIFEVEPGCGCTAVDYPKEPLLPGQTGEVEVRFDTRGFSGRQYKVIKVKANIKDQIKELVVSANVTN